MEGLDIRYTFVTDISYLRQWINHPASLKWFPVGAEKEIEDALQCWIGFSRWSCSLTATINHTPCAIGTLFLMPYKKVAHQALFKLIVDPQWRKKGVGESVIKNLKHLAKNYFHLDLLGVEVMDGNPILSLLKKQGFEEIFRQENYFKTEMGCLARVYMEALL